MAELAYFTAEQLLNEIINYLPGKEAMDNPVDIDLCLEKLNCAPTVMHSNLRMIKTLDDAENYGILLLINRGPVDNEAYITKGETITEKELIESLKQVKPNDKVMLRLIYQDEVFDNRFISAACTNIGMNSNKHLSVMAIREAGGEIANRHEEATE